MGEEPMKAAVALFADTDDIDWVFARVFVVGFVRLEEFGKPPQVEEMSVALQKEREQRPPVLEGLATPPV
ncbi:hypothetical protein MRX96_046403 [Rhipicephalus microplus]